MLAKNVIDGQNFRRAMETFMSDVQCDPRASFIATSSMLTPCRYRINGSNYSLRSIISEFGWDACQRFIFRTWIHFETQIHRAEAKALRRVAQQQG
jgi:hypothetical protein